MAELLFTAAIAILGIVAIGLARILKRSGDAEAIMATQLLGTGGIALVLIFAVAAGRPAMIDAALILALLAAFAGIAFVRATGPDRK
jgi:multicomponent Na+:H+ antiporter subunit F